MATVYLAHDVRHDRKVALKILRPELAAVIGASRFLARIRTTANLQHPHILALYDSGQTGNTVFCVMPFVSGESLRDRLQREKQLPVDDALRIAGEVADALDYAHRQGVVHRPVDEAAGLTNGGFAPLWSRDGRELFYVTPRREITVVPVRTGPTLQLGERKVLFVLPNDMYGGVPENYTPHDISPDGSRFIMMRRTRGDSSNVRVLVIENFADELRARKTQR